MKKIAIISPSLRDARYSNRVALFFSNYLTDKNLAGAEILDLREYRFPLFEERLKYQASPSAEVLMFAEIIRSADGVIIICPEYNGSFPASLKNVIDLLTDEWYHKPVAIVTVSAGNFGGMQSIIQLQFLLWKLKALTVPAMFPVPEVAENFNEKGEPADKPGMEKKTERYINELFWVIEAKKRM